MSKKKSRIWMPMAFILVVGCGLALTLVSVGCSTSDLRPEAFRGPISDGAETAGRRLLAEMAQAHGGLAPLAERGTLAVEVEDDWSMADFPYSLGKPFPDNVQKFSLTQTVAQENAQMTFVDGKLEGDVWGYQDGEYFSQPKDGKGDEVLLLSYRYFLLAPFVLGDADVVFSMGPEVVEGKNYERVFVSWGTAEPQDDIDQMIAYIESDTKRLGFLQFTFREKLKFAIAQLRYEDYQDVEGFWFPATLTAVDGVGGPPKIHRISMSDYRLDSSS